MPPGIHRPRKQHLFGIANYIFVGGDFDIFMTWVVHFDTCSTLDFHNLHLAKCSPTFHPRHAAWWHPTLHLQHLKKKTGSPVFHQKGHPNIREMFLLTLV